MKDFFKRIIDSLNLNGRDWAVLLLALLLAFSIWIIHNMALKYNDNLQASIVAVSNIDGHSARSINSCQVTARCRATGYKLLMESLRNKRRSIDVTFPSSALRHKSGDEFYIVSSDLMEYSGQIFANGVNVEYFNADTLFFRFPFVEHKKLPVNPVYSLSYRQQYMSDGVVSIEPDSVIVYGEPFRLAELTFVNTEPISHSDVHSDLNGVVKLERLKGIRLSHTEINYSIDVSRYAEAQMVARITAINVPQGKSLSFYPSVAQVAVKYEFPPVAGFSEDVTLVVDYNDFAESLSGKCPILIAGSKDGIISYDIDPPYAECMLEER